MKLRIHKYLVLLLIVGAFAASEIKAQLPNYSFTAPSSFIAGEKTYPAGDYTIRHLSLSSPTWEIFNDSRSTSGEFIAEAAHAPLPPADVKAQVVFYKYGDTLVLKEIPVAGAGLYTLRPGDPEKSAMKSGGSPQRIVVPVKIHEIKNDQK
ncbi:MAG: hypothetical protein WAK20_18450 [Candidatus Acidiferrum sp.]